MRAAVLLLLLSLTAACVRTSGCGEPSAGPEAALACRASAGDKQAQLDLGQRYEHGIGVRRDMRRAAEFYRAAASFTPGTTYVYSPPVGRHGRGMVLPVRSGADRPGLPEAKFRLALLHLRGAGVRLDFKKARKLLGDAAAAGYAPAAAKLKELNAAPET